MEELKKTSTVILLFLLPFFIISMIEVSLPLDIFTFRAWESLTVKKLSFLFPGPFYPNIKLIKTENAGDLKSAIVPPHSKKVVWETDEYGFRTTNMSRNNPEIVIIGDSFIAGSGLSQNENLAEVLKNMTGKIIYSYAPAGINDFAADDRFLKHPPKIVIFASVERFIPSLPEINETPVRKIPLLSPIALNFFVLADRALGSNLVSFLRAKTNAGKIAGIPATNGKMLFLQDGIVNRAASTKTMNKISRLIIDYKKYFARRNIRFIFMPIPDKENIYADLLPHPVKSTFLTNLSQELSRQKIEIIDLESVFREARKQKSCLLYFADDTHWSACGVKIAASFLSSKL